MLPFAVVPAQAGYFDLHAGKTVVHVNAGVPFMMRGKPVETAELPPDSKLDRMTLGDLTLFVHASGGRFGIRLKDKNSKLRQEFTGLKWYPVNEAYHFNAHLFPMPRPAKPKLKPRSAITISFLLPDMYRSPLPEKNIGWRREKIRSMAPCSLCFAT